jgi:hypothetical protein
MRRAWKMLPLCWTRAESHVHNSPCICVCTAGACFTHLQPYALALRVSCINCIHLCASFDLRSASIHRAHLFNFKFKCVESRKMEKELKDFKICVAAIAETDHNCNAQNVAQELRL